MLRNLALAALAALMLLPAGCGGDDPPPTGPPRDRFGAEAVQGVFTVETIRARLVPVTDLVGIGRHDEAAVHLRQARRLWSRISGRIRRDDPVLEREVSAGFARVESAIARQGTFDAVRDVTGPLGGQLLGGVREDLVEKDARLDPGVNAATLIRLLDRMEDAYEAGDPASLQHVFGIVDRARAVARDIAGDLGPRRDAVIEGLKALREEAFPDGIVLPAQQAPLAEVQRRADEIRAALEDRFELRDSA